MISLHNNHKLNTFLTDCIEKSVRFPKSANSVVQRQLDELRFMSLGSLNNDDNMRSFNNFVNGKIKAMLIDFELKNAITYRKLNIP